MLHDISVRHEVGRTKVPGGNPNMLGGEIVLARTKRIAIVSVGLNDLEAFHEELNTMLGMGSKGLMDGFGEVASVELAWNEVAGPIG
jgi:hypothetical protein